MMDGSIQSQIVQFNLLFKRYDDIYRRAAKQFDMPELTLWILYALREKPDCTQKDLTDLLLCKMVEKYGGVLNIDTSGQQFKLTVMLPLERTEDYK